MKVKITFDYNQERRYVIIDVYNILEILTCIEKQSKGEGEE